MEAIYTSANVRTAFQLNWGLTLFWRSCPVRDDEWLSDLAGITEGDGVRILRHRHVPPRASQFFLSTKPHVAPSKIIRSVKGRLQHLLTDSEPRAFLRNYCIRSVGTSRREVIEKYVQGQLNHHQMADPQVQERLLQFQRTYPGVDLSQLNNSAHGQYLYNLHLVIVNEGRIPEIESSVLTGITGMIEGAASKHGHALSRLSVLADHMHMTLGCRIGQSPEQVALSYLNNCALACGEKAVFKFGYFVGTIGEYDLGAVR